MRSERLIWILEDDPECMFVYEDILEARYPFEKHSKISTLSAALSEAKACRRPTPDLLIADLRVDDGNFLNFLRTLSDDLVHSLGIIVVSSCDDQDILRDCFNEGVLDYLVKPFTRNELIVKIERLIERPRRNEPAPRLVPENLAIQRGDEVLAALTARELQIFSLLYQSHGHPVFRQELMQAVWRETKVGAKTLDVHLFNLRRKLERTGYRIIFDPPESYVLLSDRMHATQ